MTDYTVTLIADTWRTVHYASRQGGVPAVLADGVDADFTMYAVASADDERQIAVICKQWARAVTR